MKQNTKAEETEGLWLMGAGGLTGSWVRQQSQRPVCTWSVKAAPTGQEESWVQESFVPWMDPIPTPRPPLGLIIAFGTTLAQAGSVKDFRRIDLEMPLAMAAYAQQVGVSRVAVVSAVGASAASRHYYLKAKGELEEGLTALGFSSLSILRPSLLLGSRVQKRRGERLAQVLAPLWGSLMVGSLKKYCPIQASVVAKALLNAVEMGAPGVEVYEGHRLFELGC